MIIQRAAIPTRTPKIMPIILPADVFDAPVVLASAGVDEEVVGEVEEVELGVEIVGVTKKVGTTSVVDTELEDVGVVDGELDGVLEVDEGVEDVELLEVLEGELEELEDADVGEAAGDGEVVDDNEEDDKRGEEVLVLPGVGLLATKAYRFKNYDFWASTQTYNLRRVQELARST